MNIRNRSLPLQISTFDSVRSNPRRFARTWEDLVEELTRIEKERDSKEDLQLLNLVTFGDEPSQNGSLRNDANVEHVYGLVADYDGAEVDIEEAAFALEVVHDVECFFYTSPSHNRAKKKDPRVGPRWRVIAPLSKPARPDLYQELMNRLNGALGGILAPESWTLSQSYYFGRVRGVEYVTRHVAGTCIDLLEDLPSIGKPRRSRSAEKRTDKAVLRMPQLRDEWPPEELEREIRDIVEQRAANDTKFQRLWAGEWESAAERPYPSASEARQALVCKLAFYAGRDAFVIDAAMRRSPLADDKWDRLSETEIRKALELVKDVHPDAGKIEVILRKNNQRALFQSLSDRLVARHAVLKLVIFGGRIKHPYVVEDVGYNGEAVQVLQLNDAQKVLGSYLSDVIRWSRVKQTRGVTEIVPADPPERDLTAYGGRPERWPSEIRVDRIAQTPIMFNGELIAEPGLSRPTRAWIHSPRVSMPNITSESARQQAEAALGRIQAWLEEFPFASETDRAVAVCALMSAAHRASVPSCPGFVFTKPSIGAGASTLAKLTNIVLTGRKPAVINMNSAREGEFEKQLDAAQLAGRASIVLDNLAAGSTLYSDALATILSEPQRRVRILGESSEVEVPCSQLVLVTGVNVSVRNDLVRRFLQCRIDPAVERPYEREFNRPNLLEEAEAQRAALLADLFTLSLSWAVSGVARSAQPLSGYAQWQTLCVEPLVWLGLEDPTQSSRALADEDEGVTLRRELVDAWDLAYGTSSVTVRELLADDDLSGEASDKGKVRQLLTGAVGGHVQNMAQAVGHFLKRIDGAMTGGRCITRGRNDRLKAATWVLKHESAVPQGFAGFAGSTAGHSRERTPGVAKRAGG